MIAITTLAALLAAPQDTQGGADAPRFAPPVRLMAGTAPLGEARLYPSPQLYDIDADGARELVIGDLFGHVMIADKQGDDVATWSELVPFATDGRPLKFKNW